MTPFAETATYYGETPEFLLVRERLSVMPRFHTMAQTITASWICVHNHYTSENLTTILSLPEYRLSILLASGYSYSKISEELHLSFGRVKNMISELYGKLHIGGCRELKALLW